MPRSDTQSLNDCANAVRAAVESHDPRLAQAALRAYCACFQARPRELTEVAEARQLLEWSLQQMSTQKAQIAEELMSLKRFCDAYSVPKRVHTWRLEG